MEFEAVDQHGYHCYRIEGTVEPLPLLFAADLLEIAAYVAQHRERLEQEAAQDDAKNKRAWDADMRDMESIKRAWEEYRNG